MYIQKQSIKKITKTTISIFKNHLEEASMLIILVAIKDKLYYEANYH